MSFNLANFYEHRSVSDEAFEKSNKAIHDFFVKNGSELLEVNCACQKRFADIDFSSLFSTLRTLPKLRSVILSGHRLSAAEFDHMVEMIARHPKIKQLTLSKSLITQEQVSRLQKLASEKKIRIIDSEGSTFGPAFMNWHDYFEKKAQMELKPWPITVRALNAYRREHRRLPAFTVDFGAGAGTETIALVTGIWHRIGLGSNVGISPTPLDLRHGLRNVWAVDADPEATQILQQRLLKEDEKIQKDVTRLEAVVQRREVAFKNLELSLAEGAPKATQEVIKQDLEQCFTQEAELKKLGITLAPESISGRVRCFDEAFINLPVHEQVDLLISNMTLPYRPSEDFPRTFNKCSQLVRPGGRFVFHLFGVPAAGGQVGMTYHTRDDVLKLLAAANFQVEFFEDNPNIPVHGGNGNRPWGSLFHVVAKKLAPRSMLYPHKASG